MTKQDAINKLIEHGRTRESAIEEFNGLVAWNLRGTLRTYEDVEYATKCAIEEIMSMGDEIIYDSLDADMLDMWYN